MTVKRTNGLFGAGRIVAKIPLLFITGDKGLCWENTIIIRQRWMYEEFNCGCHFFVRYPIYWSRNRVPMQLCNNTDFAPTLIENGQGGRPQIICKGIVLKYFGKQGRKPRWLAKINILSLLDCHMATPHQKIRPHFGIRTKEYKFNIFSMGSIMWIPMILRQLWNKDSW